jgi:phosphoribosylformylglycinamidine synthase
LPGALLRNSDLRFVCRDVWLQVENRQTIFTSSYATSIPLRIPVAHHDGNYYADEPTLDRLEETDAVAFRYCRGPDGPDEADGAANPNGSARDIAGIFNDQKNILGMMPHPERLADAALGGTDGQPLFDSLVSALAG